MLGIASSVLDDRGSAEARLQLGQGVRTTNVNINGPFLGP